MNIKYLLTLTLLLLTINIHPQEQAQQQLNKGEQAFRQEQYDQAIHHFIKAKDIAQKTNNFLLQYKATYDIGVSYFMISENSEALKYYYNALEIVQQHQLPTQAENKIMNGIAGVYFEENNYDKAQEICYKCYKQSVKQNDSVGVVTYALDLATLANKKRHFQQANAYLQQARQWNTKDEYDETLCKITITHIESLYLQQRYEEVVNTAEQLLNNPYLMKSDKAIVIIYLLNVYAKNSQANSISPKLHDNKRVFQLAEEASLLAPLRRKPELYSIIAELHKKHGNMQLALTYKDSSIIYTDSLLNIQNRKQTENLRTRIEVFKAQVEMQHEIEQLTHHRQIAMLVTVITLLLLCVALLYYLFQRQKNRQQEQRLLLQIEKEKNERLVTEQKMHETELIAHYQMEIMKKEIERKKKELAITTMFVASRNELINELIQSVNLIDQSKDHQQLAALSNHLKQLLKDSDQQKDFLDNFEEANPDFIQSLRIKHPTLSVSDIRFLAYIRMGRTMKEIATLMNIEPESCKRRKNRLSKKLELDTAADLYHYVAEL